MKKTIKSIIYRIAVKKLNLKSALKYLDEQERDIFFLQIGANDGISNDPMSYFKKLSNWSGIFLEPQQNLIPLLSANFKESRYTIVNKAFSHENGIRILYKLNFSNERWATGLASFQKEVILKHFENGYIPSMAKRDGVKIDLSNIDRYIDEESVPTISYKEIQKLNTAKISAIFVDVEGYDFEALKLIDLSQPELKLIIFESKHLSKSDNQMANELLRKNGFFISQDNENTLGIKNVKIPLLVSC